VLNPKVRYLEDCGRPTLVRMGFQGSPEMAILLDPGSNPTYWQTVVLSTCELIALSDRRALFQEFESAPVLDFGAEFMVEPEYTGYCEFGGGSLFRVPGTLVRYGDDTYDLVISMQGVEGFASLSLTSMQLAVSERGGAQVAFASWSISLPNIHKPIFVRT